MAKFGPRKPSVKKSISAKTTGKAKRKIKSSINPVYGKKGMGYVKNPKKAVYNKIYNKTSYDSLSSIKKTNKRSNNAKYKQIKNNKKQNNGYINKKQNFKDIYVAYIIWFFFGMFGGHRFYLNKPHGTTMLLLSILTLGIGAIITIPWMIIDAFNIPSWIKENNYQEISVNPADDWADF